MKKAISILFILSLVFGAAACGQNQPQSSTDNNVDTSEPTTEDSEALIEEPAEADENTNVLVAYFSMPETTDPNNMTEDEDNSVVVIDGKVLGNTEYVATLIQEHTGGQMYRLEPETPYPTDHDTLVDLVSEEQSNNARPNLLSEVENIEQYDIIYLGYPNWWGDMPMILYSFLEQYNLSDKTIIPFNTHGGSGFSDSINTIATLQPEAEIDQDGYTVSRNNVQDCEDEVIAWLQTK